MLSKTDMWEYRSVDNQIFDFHDVKVRVHVEVGEGVGCAGRAAILM